MAQGNKCIRSGAMGGPWKWVGPYSMKNKQEKTSTPRLPRASRPKHTSVVALREHKAPGLEPRIWEDRPRSQRQSLAALDARDRVKDE